ncbi:uncharacterized protein LOC122028801 isoform X1 [Zingiber officinale]|uniref:uncharacterized protein LOC122028801 isoform X1 n=1 Tax=Zingiber officinale TaxID=94328 RepID=UPI001C4CA2D2|nr:uncharacterized protein LOC122028801 isoform X1 [Zingiber officinale]XP_042443644.1 uncharacterized protein LOC122028801 isoform X1 [Zingiber officinale]
MPNAFALVLAARRLRLYFLAHTIMVMTNNPLGRVLNPEVSGRLIKWTTELREFNIQYQPRMTIKAQSLVDFVTEVQTPEPEAAWKIYVDRSSTRQGSGVGVLLISPQEEQMHLSVWLEYRATNNEAEYETLIASLQAAQHVGAIKVLIHSDSQLITQQLIGTFEINNLRLRLYAEAFEKLKADFRRWLYRRYPGWKTKRWMSWQSWPTPYRRSSSSSQSSRSPWWHTSTEWRGSPSRVTDDSDLSYS